MIFKIKVGMDEVGRGAVAGPVMVGIAVWLRGDIDQFVEERKDSKKLTEKRREKMYEVFENLKRDGFLDFSTSEIESEYIDSFGINKALLRASEDVLKKMGLDENKEVLSDFGLPVPQNYKVKHIIKGDELEPIISIASIVAKVERDRILREKSIKYCGYGLENNKGYGTKSHMSAIKKYGLTKIHRKSFLKKII